MASLALLEWMCMVIASTNHHSDIVLVHDTRCYDTLFCLLFLLSKFCLFFFVYMLVNNFLLVYLIHIIYFYIAAIVNIYSFKIYLYIIYFFVFIYIHYHIFLYCYYCKYLFI
jgi:hypothetical protein